MFVFARTNMIPLHRSSSSHTAGLCHQVTQLTFPRRNTRLFFFLQLLGWPVPKLVQSPKAKQVQHLCSALGHKDITLNPKSSTSGLSTPVPTEISVGHSMLGMVDRKNSTFNHTTCAAVKSHFFS